ncbi:MAG: FTR1 family protein [Anaerolineales bacterium]|nr:FTR1 family protein [Anaerolineales bacterium]
MLPAFLLSVREGLEMALIIGIVLGALRKFQRQELNRVVWSGVISAGILSLLIAFGLHRVGARLEEPYEQIFEGTMMLLAAGVLTWMIFWMQRQARHLKKQIEQDVQIAAAATGGRAIFALAFLAVLREGIELAIFFTAAAAAAGEAPAVLGALTGLATAAVLGWAFFAASIRLDLRRFFQFSSVLLILFAAGLVAHGVHEFNEVGLIPALIQPVWDTSRWISEDGFVGQVLKTLFGYNANPTLSEVLAYLTYFVAIAIGLRQSRTVVTNPV